MSSSACLMISRSPSILPSVDDSLIVFMIVLFPKWSYAGIYHRLIALIRETTTDATAQIGISVADWRLAGGHHGMPRSVGGRLVLAGRSSGHLPELAVRDAERRANQRTPGRRL